MTAYGRGASTTTAKRFSVEIQSLNKRHFELQCQLPAPLTRFEAKIRALVGAHVHRGQLLYRLKVSYTSRSPLQLIVDVPLLQQLKEAWRQVANQLGYDSGQPLPLELFADQNDLFIQEEVLEDEEVLWQEINSVTMSAMEQLLNVKMYEGTALAATLNSCRQKLEELLCQVQEILPNTATLYRQRLVEKLQAFLPKEVIDDERMLREVFLFAEKSDVSEETARLESHLRQCGEMIDGPNLVVGKQLEFLLQEIGREINTLGAKSSDIAVIQRVLAMKSEIEKMREQVQNIE